MSSERLITLFIVAVITLASIVLMLSCASPELSWDEADYAANTVYSWDFLWRGSSYGYSGFGRHGHGPMSIYLVKLGQEILPAGMASIEVRSRFLIAFVSSLGIGLLYWMLRHCFNTSRSAAVVGSSLLLFSVIRLEETNIIGPHHLMLVCTLAIVALGYRWRDRPSLQAALGLGAVMAFGALSMTYVIPVILGWLLAIGLAGKEWLAWDRRPFKVSWWLPLTFAIAAVLITALWPPSLRHGLILQDFELYRHYPYFATLVGDRIFGIPPRSALLYWLVHLDAPILVFSFGIILVALWNTFRSGRFSSKHAYLAVFFGFILAIMLAAHIAGARNMLQFIGVLCLTIGALFDEALWNRPRLSRFVAGAVVILGALNLLWLSQSSGYIPTLATDGYGAFLKENGSLLAEKSKAMVYGTPILRFYAQQSGTSVAWESDELPWTTRADAPLPADTQYVLTPSYICSYMPEDQPIRRVVAEHWKMVWSHKVDHVWELRLYEKPQTAVP